MRESIQPSKARKSEYGVDPKYVEKRAAELPNMTSILLKDLFPDTPETIYPSNKGLEAVREATEKALEDVDMSMIGKDDSVNICASHHGFTLLGGEPYAEMIKTVRDVVHRRTGAENIRLRAGVGLRFRDCLLYTSDAADE